MPRSWVVLLLLGSIGCQAAPKRYECVRADGEIAIDGRLDEQAWDTAAWTDAFVDIQGDEHPTPPMMTRAKMLWDDEHLYVGAVLQDDHVWATLTERDQIVFHDNDFEVFIDPDGDGRAYYEIEVNANNTIFDLFLVRTYRDGGPALHDWDPPHSAIASVAPITQKSDAGTPSTPSSRMFLAATAIMAPNASSRTPPPAGSTSQQCGPGETVAVELTGSM